MADRSGGRPFRFGVNLHSVSDQRSWAAKCRLAEQLGFDVILVPDHLGMPAPFPALVAAADVTERPRLGTFVLNAGFWNPALLAREVATVDQLCGGRFELGLGTGYVRAELEAAGLPWGSPGARVDRLAELVEQLETILPGDDQVPAPVQRPRPPLLLGGHGDRLLTLAAAHADTVAFTGATLVTGSSTGTLHLASAETLDERVAFFATGAGARAAEVESNILVQAVVVTGDRHAAIEQVRQRHQIDYLSTEALLELPTLLVGTADQIVEQLRAGRERFGFSYITVLEPAMQAMAQVIEKLAGT